MRHQPTFLLVVLALLGAVSMLPTTGFSDASFVTSSRNVGTVRAAADWTPPNVAVTAPGTSVQGTVTISATASDTESAITSVTLQHLAPGASAWTTICTDTSSPYTCSWNTTVVADGTHDLRALATNSAGYSTTSETVRTTVANKVLVVLTEPGDVVRGQVPLTATLHNGGTLPWTITVQYALAGTTQWKSICSTLSTLSTCTWSTAVLANDLYDLRAVATSGSTTVTSAVISDVTVDNTAPTVSMVDPGSPLRGTLTFATVAIDDDSGVARVTIEHLRSGTSTWQPLCTITTEPWTCRFATTSLADGSYSFRAVAIDVAGNTATSSAVANRIVDNTASSVSVEVPGDFVSGSVTITAVANSTAGVTSVRIQRAPSGTTTWTDLCTTTAAPYSCPWDTTSVADGNHDLRAILLDGRGTATTSATVTTRVDNSPLRALDVQTANGSGTAGRPDAGDTVTLTYSGVVTPDSITPGWNGDALPVSLRLRDGKLLGLGSKGDTLDVNRSGGGSVALGSILLRGDYIKPNKTASFNATMTATTITVDDVERTVVAIQLRSTTGGSVLRTATPATMSWTPSTAATSATGAPCASAPATESGPLDREF